MEEESFKEILETNRVEIVQRLQLDRTFLFDYLRSKAVFDCGDCELVHAEKTREQKAGKFLDIIETKGEDGYSHFIDAIQLLNPWLYEKITGEKSTARPNPIIVEGRESFFLGGGEGRLPDLDIMSSHLKRTISDLQDITIRYDSVLREKEQLEKRLSKASSDLQVEHRRVVELERQKSETENLLLETHSSAKKVGEGAVQHFHTMSRELNERNNYIIALQMKLLSAQEEVENLKNKLNETIQQKEGLLDRFKEVSKNYDFQRRESMQLSVKLENQKDNIQKAEELKVKYRQLQFVNQKNKAEKEEAQKELNELKVWTEALKARYDIVEEDRRQTQESHESAVADCSNMRERTDEIEIKLTICKREMEDLKNRCKDLEHAANTYRESRDLYQKAFKDASVEREQFRKEREDAMQRLAEVIHNRDEDMNKQMELGRQFEQRYEKAVEELQVVRDSLTRTELELEELKKTKLQRTPSDISENSFCSKENCMNRVGLHLNTNNLTEAGKLKQAVDQEDGSSPTDSEGSFDWQARRKTTNIIESVKKRVGMRRGPTTGSSADGSSDEMTTAPSTTQKSRSLDEKLERWVPEKKALSPEAQQSLSLDRTWQLFKTDLPYGALECMFASSMSSNASSETWVPDVDTKKLLESSFAGSTLFSSKESNTLEQPVNYEDNLDVSENGERLAAPEDRPKRPLYKKCNSSPSNILNFVHNQESYPSDATATAGGEAKSLLDSEKPNRHSLKDVAQTASYNTISSWPLRVHNVPFLDLKKEDETSREIAEALKSPSFAVPFRKRSGALNLAVIDRPRSSSVPASPVCSDVSGKRSSDTHSQ